MQLALALLAGLPTASGFDLVKDGDPNAAIVVQGGGRERRMVQRAAEDFAYHVKLITGTRVPILKAQDPEAAAVTHAVYIGESPFTRALGIDKEKLPLEGCRILADGTCLAIVGKDVGGDPFRSRSQPATWFGVAHYLEKYHGVRWLWPGEQGIAYTPKKTLSVGPVDETKRPVYLLRKLRSPFSALCSYGKWLRKAQTQGRLGDLKGFDLEAMCREYQVWERRVRLGRPVSLESGHSQWFRKRYYKDHPEYFAQQIDGTRTFPTKPDAYKLCVFNPEVAEIMAAEARQHFKRQPDSWTFNLAFSDGDGWCWCEKCKALDPPNQETRTYPTYARQGPARITYPYLTDRYVRYWNTVARALETSHPGKFIGVSLYGAAKAPPVRERLHPNILVASTSPGGLGGPDFDVRNTALEGWLKAGLRSFYWRPNLMVGNKGTPHMYPERIGALMKYFHSRGAKGFDFDGAVGHFGMDGVNYYVVLRLAWDPALDETALVREYCQRAFGEGGRAAHRYVTRCMKLHDGRPPGARPHETYTLAEVARLNALAREVEAAAARDVEPFRQRVATFLKAHRYAMLECTARVLVHRDPGPRPKKHYEELYQVLEAREELLNDGGHRWAVIAAAIRDRATQPYGSKRLAGYDVYLRVRHNPLRGKVSVYEIIQGAGRWAVIAQRGTATVDGDLAEWRRAEFSRPFLDNFTMRVPEAKTTAAVRYDDRTLFFAFRCEEPVKFYAAPKLPDSPMVCKNDSVEVMLDTNLDEKSHTHFVVDLLGQTYDAAMDAQGNYSNAWNGRWTAKVRREEKAWFLELAIPFETLRVAAPERGRNWRVALLRTRRGLRPQEYQYLSPTLGKANIPQYRADLFFGQAPHSRNRTP